jgi:hypothetical protein
MLAQRELGRKIANGLRLMRRSHQTVFVGETDYEVRDHVRNETSRMGFRVRPEAPMAFGNEPVIRTHLGEARLAVHFVGGQARQRPIKAIQLSRQVCRGATVVYEVPGYDLSPEERTSLDWIEDDLKLVTADDSRVYDRVGGKNLEQFLQILRDRTETVRTGVPTRVGIACEETDRTAVETILPEIRDRTGFSVICLGLSLLDFKNCRGVSPPKLHVCFFLLSIVRRKRNDSVPVSMI